MLLILAHVATHMAHVIGACRVAFPAELTRANFSCESVRSVIFWRNLCNGHTSCRKHLLLEYPLILKKGCVIPMPKKTGGAALSSFARMT